MVNCPICETKTEKKYQKTPYWICPSCDCWFQDPKPSKTWEADHELNAAGESTGHLISDADKRVNSELAGYLGTKYLSNKPTAKVLDIGSKYPYLAHCFRNNGYESFGIDGIDIVEAYSKELGVPMMKGDFEALSPVDLYKNFGYEKYDLITMIHVFEHIYNPKKAIEVLREIVKDDGRVFIRSPDHGVSGFERDLTEGHYTIHPFFYSQPSLLELLAQCKDKFVLESYIAINGYGQSNFVLKPIKKEPSIVVGMIVKNEERDLPICLKSIENVVDQVVVIDTGSTDKTEEVAKNTIAKPVSFSSYFGASRKDEHGDWKLWDFSKARNQFVSKIDNMPEADLLLWMDADDTLLTPTNIRRAKYNDEFDIFGVQISVGGPSTWVHHRMWKVRKGIHFEGKIHEYPTLEKYTGVILRDVVIHHDAKPTNGETSSDRNLRILLEEHTENPKNQRTCFYLGNTYLERNDYKNAIEFYKKRIALGVHYRDEYLFAMLYLARCYNLSGDKVNARKVCYNAIAMAPEWSEFWMELGYMARGDSNWTQSIGYCMVALGNPITETLLWREKNKYRDQPARVISFAYEGLGKKQEALQWAIKARDLIGADDVEWDGRIFDLEQKQVAFVRPGAFGDVIMTMNLIRPFKQANPGTEIHYYTSKMVMDELAPLLFEAGVSKVSALEELKGKEGWYNNIFDLVGYPLQDGYPFVPMQKHLLQYFGKEVGLDIGGYDEHKLPAMLIPAPNVPLVDGKYITIHPKAGWSPYKNWQFERWAELVSLFKTKYPEYAIYQIGMKDEPKIEGTDSRFMGTPMLTTVHLMAYADLHIGVDSFTNHVTNFVWHYPKDSLGNRRKSRQTPAVILWGSTQYKSAGYPHNTNISLGLSCQPCFKEDPKISAMPNGICVNPPGQTTYENPQHACMAGISPKMVLDAIVEKLNG